MRLDHVAGFSLTGGRRNALEESGEDDRTALLALADDLSRMPNEPGAGGGGRGTGGYVMRHDHIDDSCFTVGGSGRYVFRRVRLAGTLVRLVCDGALEERSQDVGGVLEGYRPTVLALE